MADDIDLRELREGSTDLARRDFRKADLSGLNLSGRDFTGAHLEGADLSGSDLSACQLRDAKTSGLKAEGANLANVRARQTVIFAVNLKNANLNGSDFSRSHFSRSNLTGADLRGANFTHSVLNEGTTFEACVVDEETKFDGATIFRPLARQDAFRFYRVERGVLVRKENEPKAQLNTDRGLYMRKPLHFSASSGEATFDYSNNDGRAFFGTPEAAFETHWTRAGRDQIHAYVNHPSITGIAIAEGATTFEQMTTERLLELDFSSRSRTPQKGQFLIARNAEGQFAAFRIKSVTSTSHGDPRDELTVEYRVLVDATDATSHEVPAPQSNPRSEIAASIDNLLAGLAEVALSEFVAPIPHAGMGHNNPPGETPIDRREFDEVVTVLRNTRAEIQNDHPAKRTIDEAASLLSEKTKKILAWAGRKLELASDEFAKEIGKSLGSKTAFVTMWLALSGAMGRVAELLTTFALRWLS